MKLEDQRDDWVGGLLDEAANELHPRHDAAGVFRKGSRRRVARMTAAALAVAVFVGAVAWAGLAIRSNGGTAGWRVFEDPTSSAWTIRYPPGWPSQSTGTCPGESAIPGAIFTNTSFVFHNPQGGEPGCDDRLVFAGFPQDGVAVVVQPRGAVIGPTATGLPDTSFPIQMAQFKDSAGIVGGPKGRYLGINFGGRERIIVSTWIGANASSEARLEVDDMVASLTLQGVSLVPVPTNAVTVEGVRLVPPPVGVQPHLSESQAVDPARCRSPRS